MSYCVYNIAGYNITMADIKESIVTTNSTTTATSSRIINSRNIIPFFLITLVVYVMLSSDIFMTTVCAKIPGAMASAGKLSFYGILIHGILFSIIWCIIISYLVL